MNLVKWNPWREMTALERHLNHFFDDSFFPTARPIGQSALTGWEPAVDVYDDGDKIVINAELPGVDKKDISIDIKDNTLTLKGERSYKNEVKEDNYYCREMASGKFQRSFSIPADLDPDKINADFKDGVLKIDVPKPEEKKPKRITVH